MIENKIRDLFAAGNIDEIINQINTLMEDRTRIRIENDGYKHEIRRLAQSFAAITEPVTGRKVSEPHPTVPRPQTSKPKAAPKSSSKEALDLDL